MKDVRVKCPILMEARVCKTSQECSLLLQVEIECMPL